MPRSKQKPSPEPVRRKVRADDGDAFFPDPQGGPAHARGDALADELAEEFIRSATSGEEQGEEGHEQVVDEELGGPFVLTSAETEFASGSDASNPKTAKREPFPTTAGTGGIPRRR